MRRLLLKNLEWDSKVLGVPCGLIDVTEFGRHDTEVSLMRQIKKICRKRKDVDFITVKVSSDHLGVVNSLIGCGALLIDAELTFTYRCGKTLCYSEHSCGDLRFSFCRKYESKPFIPLAKEMRLSRFFRDPMIPKKNALRLWEASIKNHCAGFADQLVIAFYRGVPCGLSALNFKEQGRIYLHIVGVLKGYRGRGIGRRMLQAIAERYGDDYALCVETQSDNYAAQHVYHAAGFRYHDLKYVLHYWRHSRGKGICE